SSNSVIIPVILSIVRFVLYCQQFSLLKQLIHVCLVTSANISLISSSSVIFTARFCCCSKLSAKAVNTLEKCWTRLAVTSRTFLIYACCSAVNSGVPGVCFAISFVNDLGVKKNSKEAKNVSYKLV